MNSKRAASLKRAASKHMPRTRSATATTQKKRELALKKARAAHMAHVAMRRAALSPIKESRKTKSKSKTKSKTKTKSKSKTKTKSKSKSNKAKNGGFLSFF
jgi:arginine/serine-rich splicing factor 4/5/6